MNVCSIIKSIKQILFYNLGVTSSTAQYLLLDIVLDVSILLSNNYTI